MNRCKKWLEKSRDNNSFFKKHNLSFKTDESAPNTANERGGHM